jgi:hypothetical protein
VSAAGPIAQAIARDSVGFEAEQAEVCTAYADLVEADHRRFVAALAVLGPTLGVAAAAGDAPSDAFDAILGVPPPIPMTEPR